MIVTAESLCRLFANHPMSLATEEILKQAMASVMTKHKIEFKREHTLNPRNRVDFFIKGPDIAIEVKIKGGAQEIYKQLERYCKFEEVKSLLLVTNRSMGVPANIAGKDVYVVKLGVAWL